MQALFKQRVSLNALSREEQCIEDVFYENGNRFVMQSGIKIFMTVILMLQLNACSTERHNENEPKTVNVTFNVGKKINPGFDDRASPVEAFIYELSDDSNFSGSDYFTLVAGSNPAVVSDIKFSKQLILIPGVTKKLNLTLEKEVNYIAVMVAYRNINNAQWSAVYSLPRQEAVAWYQKMIPGSEETLELVVSVEQLSVSINEVK